MISLLVRTAIYENRVDYLSHSCMQKRNRMLRIWKLHMPRICYQACENSRQFELIDRCSVPVFSLRQQHVGLCSKNIDLACEI